MQRAKADARSTRAGRGRLLAGAAAPLALAAFTPIHAPSHDQLFEIPKGTWARRMAGNKVEILPAELRLTLGRAATSCVLHNLDDVPQLFGPILMMPGPELPAAVCEPRPSYQFACTAHASGQMTIVVEPKPATPWARLRWRVRHVADDRADWS